MLRVAHRTRPYAGETRNGDRAIVRIGERASLLVLVDALGHGVHAAEAADVAERTLAEISLDRGLGEIIRTVHEALRGSRGAALTALLVHDDVIEAGGVGNVALRTHGISIAVAPVPGVVGARIRTLRTAHAKLTPGARIVLHTDGVSTRFDLADYITKATEETADALFAAHARAHDDATLIVVDRPRL